MISSSINQKYMRFPPISILAIKYLDKLFNIQRHNLAISIDLSDRRVNISFRWKSHYQRYSGRDILAWNCRFCGFFGPLMVFKECLWQPAFIYVNYDLIFFHDFQKLYWELLPKDNIIHAIFSQRYLLYMLVAHIHIMPHYTSDISLFRGYLISI